MPARLLSTSLAVSSVGFTLAMVLGIPGTDRDAIGPGRLSTISAKCELLLGDRAGQERSRIVLLASNRPAGLQA